MVSPLPPRTESPPDAATDPASGTANAPSSRERRRRRPRIFDGRRPVSVLPTAFTLGNLLCGFMALFMASRPMDTPIFFSSWTPLTAAAAFVFLGLVCDGLDGRVARLTNTTSELGAQLDSLADMVCFGVAPAFIMVQVIGVQGPFFFEQGDTLFDRLGLVIACIYVACAGMRLARFNLEVEGDDVRHHLFFHGLPSPGAAGAVAGMVLLHQQIWARDAEAFGVGLSVYVLMAATLLCAVAMVSRFKYVHLMNRYLRDKAPFPTLVAGTIVVLMLLVWPQPAMAVGFVAYACSAPVAWGLRALKGAGGTDG